MTVNIDFQVERKEVSWNGQQAAVVRGLTPHDILKIIAENPADADAVLGVFENDAKAALSDDEQDADQVADVLQVTAKQSLGQIVGKAPDLLAKVIAAACDSPDQWQFIRDKFVLPLQFDLLQEVARLTFIDPPGFRRFVGNVMALIGALKPTQRQDSEQIDSAG